MASPVFLTNNGGLFRLQDLFERPGCSWPRSIASQPPRRWPAPVLKIPLCFRKKKLQAPSAQWPQAAALVTTSPSERPEQTNLVRDLRQGRKSAQGVRLGDRLFWPIHFTSPARHGGARLGYIGVITDVLADRLIFLPQTHRARRPGPFLLSSENTSMTSLR